MNEKTLLLQEYMISQSIDLVFLENPTSVAYFTNFDSNPMERIVAYVITQTDHFLFVPALEIEKAKETANISTVYSYSDDVNPWEVIAKEASKLIGEINYFCVDESFLTVEREKKLRHALLDSQKPGHTISYDDISEFINQIRVLKTADEIERMLHAGQLADEAVKIGINFLKEGITEQEVVAKIEMEMKKRGVAEMSFSTMVLFGENAANPHGIPGNRPLQQNEFVLFDLGVIFEGYASDTTRTIAFGEVDERKQKIYDVVLKAQLTAQKAVKPGIKAGELDQIARQVITDAGYGEYFTHRLGHGIGKTAHEFPSITGDNDTILEPGMCFSIEPGIYIQGDVGVRIEDCVYVTDDGCEPFTVMDKTLHTIIN